MAVVPRVSIGIPVYNGERFLEESLDSLLAQTFEDFELIISDNASVDRTEEICREYAARDSRIRYSRNSTNIGAANNFNRVFELSRGEYFRWSSADDRLAPTFLELGTRLLDEHPEVVLCYAKTVLIDDHGAVIRFYDDNLDLRAASPRERYRAVLQNLGLANAQYGLMRADVLRRTAVFGNYPGADMVLLSELTLHGQIWEIPQHLFFRRMHDEASSALIRKGFESVQEFWDPGTKGSLNLYRWRHRFHNVNSIFRAPIGIPEKIQLIYVTARYAFQARDAYLKELLGAASHLFIERS